MTQVRTRAVAVAAVAIAAAVLRLGYVAEVHDEPAFSLPQVDAADYHTRAVQVSTGEGLGAPVYYKAPAYAWCVGQVYRVCGPRPEVVYGLQVLGGVLVACMAAVLGMRWFGIGAGVVAGLATGLYPRLVYYETQLLMEPAALAVSTLAVLLVVWRSRAWVLVAAGALLGLSVQLRPLNGFLVVALLVWLLAQTASWPERCRRAVLLVAPVLLFLLPTAHHNRLATGHLVPISVNGGINFYIGNNLDYDETVAIRPGLRWEELTKRFGSLDDPVQWERNFYGAALRSMRESPWRHLALFGKKCLLVWNAREIDRNQDSAPLRAASRILRGLGMPWAALAIFGLAGLALTWRRCWRALPLHGAVVFSFLGIVAFFVTSRYRLCLVPYIAVAAGWMAVECARALWRRARRRLILLAAALAAAALIVLPDWTGLERQSFGRPDFDRAMVLARLGQRQEALAAYELALAADPDDPDVVYRYGEHLELMGRREEALAAFARAAALAPRSYKPCLSLGAALLQAGDLDAAWTAFVEAERRGDPSGRTLFDQGLVRERQGQFEAAAALFERSLTRVDTSAEMAARRLGLGRCLVLLKRPEVAEVHFRAAEELLRDPVPVALERAEAWLRAGEPTRVLAVLQTVPRLDDNVRGQMLRARAVLALGRRDEAEAAVRRALTLDPGSEAGRRLLESLSRPR